MLLGAIYTRTACFLCTCIHVRVSINKGSLEAVIYLSICNVRYIQKNRGRMYSVVVVVVVLPGSVPRIGGFIKKRHPQYALLKD